MTFFRERPELLAGFRRGEKETLERVYWAYVDRLEQLVRRGFFLSHKSITIQGANPDEIADLVQEAFARAFEERARLGYDGMRDYGPYLSTIARNLLVDRARRQGKELPLDSLPADLEPLVEAADPGPAWADPAIVVVVEAYLADLASDLRAVHEQRYVLGHSQEAAAAQLGISRQQLRTCEGRLRKGLARALRRANLSTG
jgi:RNA polymerase sigma-70 factor (ECF subfamily)